MPQINYSVGVKDRKSEGDSHSGGDFHAMPAATGNPSINATVTTFKVACAPPFHYHREKLHRVYLSARESRFC